MGKKVLTDNLNLYFDLPTQRQTEIAAETIAGLSVLEGSNPVDRFYDLRVRLERALKTYDARMPV